MQVRVLPVDFEFRRLGFVSGMTCFRFKSKLTPTRSQPRQTKPRVEVS